MLVLVTLKIQAQNSHKIDSLTRVLNQTTDPETKFDLYRQLSFWEDDKKKYKSPLLINAELSGDKELQLRTYRLVSELVGSDSSQFYLDKMFALAKEEKNQEYLGWYQIYTGASDFYGKGNPAKAMERFQEANTIAAEGHFDSLAYETYGLIASVHQDQGKRLLEYKSYMQQLSLADKIGDGNVALGAYWQIFWFYNGLKQYSKAKEVALKILEIGKKKNWKGWVEGGNHLLTHYHTNVSEFETAKYYYDETNRLRKQNGNILTEDDDLLDLYGMARDYTKLLRVLQKDDIRNMSFKRDSTGFYYYASFVECYTKLGIPDSAFYFLQKMKKASEGRGTIRWRYYSAAGDYFKLINKVDSAALNYAKADSGFVVGNSLEARISRYANLDTLYARQGDYAKAYHYKTLWMQYKDSAAALAKDGELVMLEIDSENQRAETERRKSHNIQYMGITAGLASIFIILVLLGVFSSSTIIIRGLGFFSFIFFFEFLILIFDNVIHDLTHGEPWKVLAIKIMLIAMLLPLHHYVEHKVVHHLLHRKKINLLNWKKKKAPAPPVT